MSILCDYSPCRKLTHFADVPDLRDAPQLPESCGKRTQSGSENLSPALQVMRAHALNRRH